MDRVEEIETAIKSLTSEQYIRLVEWFRERDHAVWDEQMDRDAASGKLDFLIREADEEADRGGLREWPPTK